MHKLQNQLTYYFSRQVENKVLLVTDNQDSHITVASLNRARDNDIVLLTLPPHTSRKLQPLDWTLHGPFK